MNLVLIAWRSIQQRGLASALTMLSMALGVMLVVAVLVVHSLIDESFKNNAGLGYNMIVGAKGGKLQLTLNTVYYLSQPVENISYEFYLEFHEQARRDEELKRALFPHESRDGKFGPYTSLAVPLCLGDYYGEFRVVGTSPDMFNSLTYGPAADRPFTFAQGRNFETWNEENGFFEAVVGSRAAYVKGIKVGDRISPSHGAQDGKLHDESFTVVGILAPTGTPNDRAVFVNMEGFYLMENHAKPLPNRADDAPEKTEEKTNGDGDQDEPTKPAEESRPEPKDKDVRTTKKALPIEQREVTAILVRLKSDLYASFVQNPINEGKEAQAVAPIAEIYRLFEVFVRPAQLVLLGLTVVICVVSGVGILVSIYNSMSDRRHEIAVMRALGARRDTVMAIILAESVVISLLGGAIGFVGAHLLGWAASPLIEARTGVRIGLFSYSPLELYVIGGVLLLAVLVGLLPAFTAYRTDVAKSLGK